MVSHGKRSSKVEFFQGDPEDCEKVLVPHVDVYRSYCWDGYSFDSTCTILVASEWVWLGYNFPLVVSVVFIVVGSLYDDIEISSSRLSVSCHILFPVCCFYPRLVCIYRSHNFFRPTDCVEPMAYGFLVLIDSFGPYIDSDFFFFHFCFYYRRLLMYDRSDVLQLQNSKPSSHKYLSAHYSLFIFPSLTIIDNLNVLDPFF
jgi:hypothetical protein